jgi:spermidine dehydrogenase
MNHRDRSLGMDRIISRRDFLNGVSVTVTGSLVGLSCRDRGAPPRLEAGDHYPPALTGLRGDHPGSFEVAHELRDGRNWDAVGSEADTGEVFDLIVVGGGLSGLAAAYFFRKQAGLESRILVLDNHDDFGGHAKRNEFRHQGRLLLMNGGTMNIEAPAQYSPEAKELLREVGVDTARFFAATSAQQGLYRSLGLSRGVFFDRETFGEDRLVAGYGKLRWPEFLAKSPLAEPVRKDIARLYDEDSGVDYWPELTSSRKKEKLARMSYRSFLLDVARVHPGAVPFFQSRTHGLFCLGIDAVPALYCWEMGYPGFHGMKLDPTPPEQLAGEAGGQHGRESEKRAGSGQPDIYFPDGNATLARLLVRSLIPDAVPGSTMEDVVTARADYAKLDAAGSRVRIRLDSTAVRVRQREGSSDVEVTYVSRGEAHRVRSRYSVLACWNSVIPAICPELPERQKEALRYGIKAPIVYTSVLIRDWTSFVKLGVSHISAPGGFHTGVGLCAPVSLGDYQTPLTPEEPMALHLVRTPCAPGHTKKEQHRAGRLELLDTTFETFERNIRDQLGRSLGGGGFDPARDIEAITVNRWPHGYAYTYNSLYDPIEWTLGTPDDRPCVIARKPYGRIAIANSDAAASPHTDAAINEAHRAVGELLSASVRGLDSTGA